MRDFVAAIDQGTTSTRFMVFDHDGNEIAKHQLEHQQILPRAGWVEHNPIEIWERTTAVAQTVLSTHRLDRRRPRRTRYYQSTRDDSCLESAYRPPVRQRHRLAGHANRTVSPSSWMSTDEVTSFATALGCHLLRTSPAASWPGFCGRSTGSALTPNAETRSPERSTAGCSGISRAAPAGVCT